MSSRAIAADAGIPERLLARVLVDLVGAGLVEAQVGRAGGYRLRRPAAEVTVLELVEALEGPSRSDRCVLHQRACNPDRPCAIHPVWATAQSGLLGVLGATTLADLAERDRALGRAVPQPSFERTA